MSATKDLLLECLDIIGEHHETFNDDERREHAFRMGLLAMMKLTQILGDDDSLHSNLLGIFQQYHYAKQDGYYS
jgi:hypothetical protein